MANSDLINLRIPFPHVMLNDMYKVAGGRRNISTRLQNFITQGHIGYYDAKNFLSDYQNFSDEEQRSNGGHNFFKFIHMQLAHHRNRVSNHKDQMMAAGESNTHIKPHEKREYGKAHTPKKVTLTMEQYNKLKNI